MQRISTMAEIQTQLDSIVYNQSKPDTIKLRKQTAGTTRENQVSAGKQTVNQPKRSGETSQMPCVIRETQAQSDGPRQRFHSITDIHAQSGTIARNQSNPPQSSAPWQFHQGDSGAIRDSGPSNTTRHTQAHARLR